MRVAVVDIGTNSTRLLVADADDGRISELERRSTVTRLGRGVDTSKQLAAEAIEEVCNTVADYIEIYERLRPEAVIAVATSAVRDAENASAFIAELRERFALDARILDGAPKPGSPTGARRPTASRPTPRWWWTSAAAPPSSWWDPTTRSHTSPRCRRGWSATASAT
jgi:exopolyphosphatase/guanosine-5'-triphosphate,3'-diphosphate pyrophosphatase